MRFTVITLFPESLVSPLEHSILGQARKKGLWDWQPLALRSFCPDKHATADDHPFGGGAGMVLKAEPVLKALESARAASPGAKALHLSPRGRRLDQAYARELSLGGDLILLCSHYEGLDERALAGVDGEVSIGDLVLSGGELAACVLIDAVVRLLPGALGNQDSIVDESFEQGLLEYPHYTRPAQAPYGDVPEVLTSGNHAAIERWRREQSLKITFERRPDLLARAALSKKDLAYLRAIGWQGAGQQD
ncbi:MAG TPA: tRNA (guanosine(37)-N1)-methyltransferase TrmD [bacterium]|nr:tRNA (guanosine(37)-N1)-methyltransferase TrmD [bacterium]